MKTPAEAKKDDLVALVKSSYNDAADNVYDTWTDTYLVRLYDTRKMFF